MTQSFLQIWIPVLEANPFDSSVSRDLQRAQEEWRGEFSIWLLPGLKETKRWAIEIQGEGICYNYREMAIPAEHLNQILVGHVFYRPRAPRDKTLIFPPFLVPEEWKGRLPEDLLEQWLNTAPELCLGERTLKVNAPEFVGDQITFVEEEIPLKPGPMVPITEVRENEASLTWCWPPPGKPWPKTVSPAVESKEYCGIPVWVRKEEVPGVLKEAVVCGSLGLGLNIWHRWPQPFSHLFRLGLTGLDAVYHWGKIKHSLLEKNREEIASWVSKFSSQGWTTLELTYLLPVLEALGSESLLWDIEGAYGLSVGSFKELVEHRDYSTIFRTPIPVTRLFGWLGYFWWKAQELAARERKHFVLCERCGRLLKGKKGKRFCGPEDNLECYRSRKAEDQRRSRERRGKGGPPKA